MAMKSPADRRDAHAARLAVDVGFCAAKDVERALQDLKQAEGIEPKVGLAYQLLRTRKITPAQYSLLNAGVRHELQREEDLHLAHFLVSNHLIKQAQVDALIEEQTPYYREGKAFPRLKELMRRAKLLETEEIHRALKVMREGEARSKKKTTHVLVQDPPARPEPKPTVRPDRLQTERCKITVRGEHTEAPDGTLCEVHTVRMEGQLDAHNARAIDEFLQAMISRGQVRIVADMSPLLFISSPGIGALVAAARVAREKGGDLRFAAVPPQVQTVLAILAIDRAIKTFDSPEGAVKSFKTKYR
jgi:anti-sigma B factor antagonist